MVESYTPSHKDFRVDFRAGEYRSSLKTLKVKFQLKQWQFLVTGRTQYHPGVQSRRGYGILERTNEWTQNIHLRSEWPRPWGQHQPKRWSCIQCVDERPRNAICMLTLRVSINLVNHSCEPNATFDMSSPDRSKWQLRALKDIHAGDDSMSTDLLLISTSVYR